MRLGVAGVVLFALAASGCAANFDETTFVRVGRPAAVKVGVNTPSGGEWLLEAGDEQETKEVPDSKPPLTEGRKFATVTRSPPGEVELACPSCNHAETAHLVPRYSDIELKGDIGTTLKWTPDTLNMRYSHIANFPCRRGVRQDCPREAIALWLQTPRENVIEVRHLKLVRKANGEMTGAKIEVGVGIGSDAIGLALAGAFAFDKDTRQSVTIGVASAFLAVGTFFLATGLRALTAEDVDTVVYRAPIK